MYDTIIGKFNRHTELNLYYGDTDSVTMEKSTWDFLRGAYPEIKDYNYMKNIASFYGEQKIKMFGEFECEFFSD
jgi:hypothetical protein